VPPAAVTASVWRVSAFSMASANSYFGGEDGHDTRQRPQPHGTHEGQRPDQLVHAAQPVEHAADGEMRQRVHHHVAGAEKAQRHRHQHGGEGAEEGHGDAFRQAVQNVLPLVAGAGWDHQPDDRAEPAEAVPDPDRCDVEPYQQRDQPGRGQCRDRTPRHAHAGGGGEGVRQPQPPGGDGLGGRREQLCHQAIAPMARRRRRSEIMSMAATIRMISTTMALISS
jgi:hypothetical protein